MNTLTKQAGTPYWKIGCHEGDYYTYGRRVSGWYLGGLAAELEMLSSDIIRKHAFWSENEAEEICAEMNRAIGTIRGAV